MSGRSSARVFDSMPSLSESDCQNLIDIEKYDHLAVPSDPALAKRYCREARTQLILEVCVLPKVTDDQFVKGKLTLS